MISADQPTCFPSNVQVALSSRADGTMLDRTLPTHAPEIIDNRQRFCISQGIEYRNVVYQRIVYSDHRTYDMIAEVDDGSTTKHTPEVAADALYTRSRNVALLLPVADCVATVVYDPTTEALALLHLGRHSTLTPLLARVLDKMTHEGADPENIIVWMSPNAHASHYTMKYFDHAEKPDWREFCERQSDGYHLDLQGYNQAICLKHGLRPGHIHTSPINTVTDPNYFSHSAGDVKGRFAVVMMLR